MKVNELFEGVDKRPQSMIPLGAKVAAEQLRKMGMKVRIDTRVIGRHEKSNRTVMTVDGDIEEAAILKVLRKNEVEYATVGSQTKNGTKSRMIRLVTPNLHEAVAEPVKRFKKGQIVTVKKTGEEVEVLSQNELGLVFTASKDAVKIPNDKKLKVVPGKGYKEYMPRELQESSEKKYEARKFYIINRKNLVRGGPFENMGDASTAQSKIAEWTEIVTGSHMNKYFGEGLKSATAAGILAVAAASTGAVVLNPARPVSSTGTVADPYKKAQQPAKPASAPAEKPKK